MWCSAACLLFFFNDTATTEIYTLSLHDALPISGSTPLGNAGNFLPTGITDNAFQYLRSEEHTSELQSHEHLVCRLLLEKKLIDNVNTLTFCGPCSPHGAGRLVRRVHSHCRATTVHTSCVRLVRQTLDRILFFLMVGEPPELTSFPPPTLLRC